METETHSTDLILHDKHLTVRADAIIDNLAEIKEMHGLMLELRKARNSQAAVVIEETRARMEQILEDLSDEMLTAGIAFKEDQMTSEPSPEIRDAKIAESQQVIAAVQKGMHSRSDLYFGYANKLAERIPTSVASEQLRKDLLDVVGYRSEGQEAPAPDLEPTSVALGRFGHITTKAKKIEPQKPAVPDDADEQFRQYAGRVINDLSERNLQQLLLDVLTLGGDEGQVQRTEAVTKMVKYIAGRLNAQGDEAKLTNLIAGFLTQVRDGERPNPYFLSASPHTLTGVLPVTMPTGMADEGKYVENMTKWLKEGLKPGASHTVQGPDTLGIAPVGAGLNRGEDTFDGVVKGYRGNGARKVMRAKVSVQSVANGVSAGELAQELADDAKRDATQRFKGLYAYDENEIRNTIVTLPANRAVELHMTACEADLDCIIFRDERGNLKITDKAGGKPTVFREIRGFEKVILKDPFRYFKAPGKLVFHGQSVK